VVSPRGSRTFIAAVLVIVAADFAAQTPFAQAPAASRSRVVIPFLANATKSAALEFEGAECDVDASGTRMVCAFQQLFLTTSPMAPDTCLVTTNRYDRIFLRDAPNHWTSSEGPEGVCGLLDVATLQDDGGVRWTMELKKEVTKKEASAACLTMNVQPEVFSWRNIRRPLPCKNVQPGGLTP
jgi:hypothetical protein